MTDLQRARNFGLRDPAPQHPHALAPPLFHPCQIPLEPDRRHEYDSCPWIYHDQRVRPVMYSRKGQWICLSLLWLIALASLLSVTTGSMSIDTMIDV